MKEILNIAKEAALKAGEVVMKYYHELEITYKETNNIVTQADKESEKTIVEYIKKQFPDHLFYGEEDENRAPTQSDHLWVIDPLDGTNNYAHHIPQFSISIAYAQKGVVKAGCVFDPMRKELFSAYENGGSFLNDSPIHVTQNDDIHKAIIATGFYYDRGELMEKTLDSIKVLFQNKICGIRRMGSAALDLSWLACGRYDGYFEYMLCPWDFAAGMLILREAGGVCVDRIGQDMRLTSTGMIASNSKLKDQMLSLLKWK